MVTKKSIEEDIQGLQSDNATVRDKHFFSLLPISEESPEKLYLYWEIFVDLLRKEKVSQKYVAIHLLANLVRVDTEKKFDPIVDEFYALLSHESPVVSPHVAGVSGKIVLAKPSLQSKIIPLLLDIDQIGGCRHHELMKSYIIQAFDDCFDVIKNQKNILDFVKLQVNSESPKTRKAAKEFIQKHSLEENFQAPKGRK